MSETSKLPSLRRRSCAALLIAALGLLFNRAPAAALLLLLPIITVIILFHLVLNPAGTPVATALALLTGALLFAYRDRYVALLR